MARTSPNPQPKPCHEQEARAIRAMLADPERRAVNELVVRQFDTMQVRAGYVLTFCGVVITTTGFSGRLIAGTNTLAQGCIITGVALVLAAAWMVLVAVLRVKWTTQSLDPGDAALAEVLERRDRRNTMLRAATLVAMVGMSFYVAAIAIMLAYPDVNAIR